MMAISNSKGFWSLVSTPSGPGARPLSAHESTGGARRKIDRLRAFLRRLFLACCASFSLADVVGDVAVTPVSDLARRTYIEARQRHQSDTNQVEAAWQFARACFDWGDFAENDGQRAQIAKEGIAVSRLVVGLDPKLAAGHYYLAFNLGQLARTKLLGALGLVREMEREFKSARELDENFDFAGPDRSLGQLYFEAPGWPTSIGDTTKAREHLQRAVQLCGRYPDNRLLLMEVWIDSRKMKDLERETKSYAEMLGGMRGEFAGEKWTASWADWDRRWKAIQEKVEKLK